MSRIKPLHPLTPPLALLLVSLFFSSALAGSLASESASKIGRIASMFASEIAKKAAKGPPDEDNEYCRTCHSGLKEGMIKIYVEFAGKPAEEAREMGEIFLRRLTSSDHTMRAVPSAGQADVVIKGLLLKFRGKERWQIRIKAFRKGGSAITSFDGILTGR